EFFIENGVTHVFAQELRELPALRDFDDEEALNTLAHRFEQRVYEPGEVIVEFGNPMDQVLLIAHGKLHKIGRGEYGAQHIIGTLSGGDYFGDDLLTRSSPIWPATVKTTTTTTVLTLSEQAIQRLVDENSRLREHLASVAARPTKSQNKH